MSVEQHGARLLGEVQGESLGEVSDGNLSAHLLGHTALSAKFTTDRDLLQLLKELRTTLDPTPKNTLGLPQVDSLLELFRYHQRYTPPHGPGWTSTTDPGAAVSDDELDDYEAEPIDSEGRRPTELKYRPPIIEASSTRSAAGKTTLLYQLAALAILPRDHGGKESAVLWLDTDNSFSATRIAQVASHLLAKTTSKPASTHDDVTTSALRHLYILKPTSSISLLNALHSLLSHLLIQTSRSSPNRSLALLILDSTTAFAYQDRFDADIVRLEAGPGPDTASSKPSSRISKIITALRQIQHDFECTIIFTTAQQSQPQHKQSLNRLKRPAPSDHPSVPAEAPAQSPWTAFATLTLHVSRIPIARFAPNMSLDGCLRDREKRQEAVKTGRFAVGLNLEGSGMWPGGVRDVVNTLRGRGGFVVRIDEKGLDVE